MNLNRFKWTFIRNKNFLAKDVENFLSKLVNNNINYFTHLKVVIKPEDLIITGYAIQSPSEYDSVILREFLYNSIDIFLAEYFNDHVNKAEYPKSVLYINSLGRMFVYYCK